MKNNSQATIRKIARKSLASSPGRNVIIMLAIFITTFMLTAIISICMSQIEAQRLFLAQYGGIGTGDIEPIIYILVLIAVLMLIAGYLLIYNVMSVSVSKDIRFYGLLKTIGMTAKQVKRMVLFQILNLCAIGISLGLLCSALASLAIVPMFLNMYTGLSQIVSFHPLIFISAALFSLITALMSAFIPIGKAASISPVEAVRYSEYGYARNNVRLSGSNSGFNPMKIAWRNVLRVPKRVVPVFIGMFLGMTMFMSVATILRSSKADMFANEAAEGYGFKGDIHLINRSPGYLNRYELNPYDNLYAFSPGLMNDLYLLPGLTEISVSYFHRIQMNIGITDAQGEINHRLLPGTAYGLDAKGIAMLNENLEYPVDEATFMRGEFIIMRDNGEQRFFNVGVAEVYFEGREMPEILKIGGISPPEFLNAGINKLPEIYMSASLIESIAKVPAVYDVVLSIEKNKQKQVYNTVKEWTASQPYIRLNSAVALNEEADNILATLSVIGGSISAILWFVGIINFFNIITTSILARRYELALLECIGQSKKQSRNILMCEGFIYASITLLLVGVLGGAITYVLVACMARQMDYVVFTFPFVPFIIMVVAVFAICLGIPGLVYCSINKMTIVERLREAE